VLGNLITGDGAANVGIIYLNDAYGTGLKENAEKAIKAAGGNIVASEAFNEGDSQFGSQIDAVLAQKPDAIALIAFDQTKIIIPELVGTKGFDASKVYFVDGNLADYSKDFAAGMLNCAKGTLPGVLAKEDFKAQLLGVDKALTDFSYSAESYDAVNLLALAAVAAKDTSGPGIQSKLQAVSEGGTKCKSFAECADLLAAGTDIDYEGISGPITFDENGDPTEAYIGIYQYGKGNTYAPLNSEFGSLAG
jgi:branched-chain amino acid transport system substrate-binding protein